MDSSAAVNFMTDMHKFITANNRYLNIFKKKIVEGVNWVSCACTSPSKVNRKLDGANKS